MVHPSIKQSPLWIVVCRAASALDLVMVTPICDKCRRRNVVSFHVEPKEAWRTVVLNRWRANCRSRFDAEAERAGVRYQFVDLGAVSWSDKPEPARRYGRKRR